MTTTHGRTARILEAIETGTVTPPEIGRRLGLPTAAVRETLFRLRRSGRVTRTAEGEWATLPSPDSTQILDVLSLIEFEGRRWAVSELAMCTDLTLGQVIAITDVLAKTGLIERIGTGSFRSIEPEAQLRH